MRDRCKIERPGDPVFDPVTGQYTSTATPIYTGPCRLKEAFTSEEAQAGEQQIRTRRYTVSLPWDKATTPVKVEDVVTLTASDDAWVTGVALYVISVEYGSDRSARRLVLEERSDG